MDIRLDNYKIFNEVANKLSFSKASESLFITQSAVSQSIKTLETALGTQLFIRDPKNIKLTNQGQSLYHYTKIGIESILQGENLIKRNNNLEDGQLRISASDTISNHLLVEHLELFTTYFPNVKLKIINRTSLDSINLLKSGKVDLCFVNLPIEDDSVNVKSFYKIHDIFVAGSKFNYLKNKTLTLEELSLLPLIFLEDTSNSRIYVDNFFKENNIKLVPEIELGSHDSLLEFAKSNIGVSCVSKELSKNAISGDDLFEIKTDFKIPPRGIGICTLKNFQSTPASSKFMEMILDKMKYR